MALQDAHRSVQGTIPAALGVPLTAVVVEVGKAGVGVSLAHHLEMG